jgi:biotin transport system substrate-specific component
MNINITRTIDNIKTGAKTYSRSTAVNLLFALGFAVLMAISANSFIYLPFTPVPITTQVLTVLLSGLFLGSRWALASQILYILMGLMGLPVFSGFKNAALFLTGPTVGYVLGFTVAAFITGYLYENINKKADHYLGELSLCFISCLVGAAIIHFFGFTYLFGYLFRIYGTQSISSLLIMTWKLGTQPFLIIDLIKIITAVSLVSLNKIRE